MGDTPRILLVVTGDLELAAFAAALGRVFPMAYFEARMSVGLTGPEGRRLRAPNPGLGEAKGVEIVEDLLGAAIPTTPGGDGFDFAVALDDVELVNEPGDEHADAGVATILEHVALSVDLVLARARANETVEKIPKGHARRDFRFHGDADRRKFLRECCSFHLLRPMVEALFFGDLEVIRAELGKTKPRIYFDPMAQDIEAFAVDDDAYLTSPNGWIPSGARGAASWATENRRRHPKHYLQYLLDPTGTVRRPFREKEHGKRMLEALHWERVVGPDVHARMVRSFLRDVAEMVGVAPRWLESGASHPTVSRKPSGRLRNVL